MSVVNVIYHDAPDAGLYRAAVDFMSLLRYLGHTVATYPVREFSDQPLCDIETGDLTVLLISPYMIHKLYRRHYTSKPPPHIGYWYWETTQVPVSWGHMCKSYGIDTVWAPTSFIKQSFDRSNLNITTKKVRPYVRPPAKFTRRDWFDKTYYNFLYVCNVSCFDHRKNPIGLIKAFTKAFGGSDKARLTIKTLGARFQPGFYTSLVAAMNGSENISVMDVSLSATDVYSLIDSADCYVSPHRSEGLGLTLIEAAFLGKPVIATGFSGNLDFMPTDYPLFVDYELVTIPREVPFCGGFGYWAEPSIDDMAVKLRNVYENKEWAEDCGLDLKSVVSLVFNKHITACILRSALCDMNIKPVLDRDMCLPIDIPVSGF